MWIAFGVFWFLGLGAVVLSTEGKKAMNHASDASSIFALSSPGVVAMDDVEVPATREIYGFFPGGLTGLHTVEYIAYGNRHLRMEATHSVEWLTSVPRSSKLFSATAGISPAKVREFWVGWISDGHAHLRSLSNLRTLSAVLEQNETAIFPAVMDGSGAASLYTWRPTEKGATLWQRGFSPVGVSPARFLAEIKGQPIVSGVAAIPGLRSRHAVVGWIARTEQVASDVGAAVVEDQRVTVRLQALPWSAPIPRQRLGIWAHALDQIEVAGVVVGDGVPASYTLAKLGVNPERLDGELRADPLALKPGQLVSAAVDYVGSSNSPHGRAVLLTIDGQLLDTEGNLIRSGVSLDSVLPIALTRRGRFWGTVKADGSLAFEPL